jgi:YidC/Oxa1 family membrane protein insertase
VTEFFTLILLDPMINFLVILNNVLFGSFGLSIIAFTIFIRLVTWPLTLRQLNSTRAMQGIQPKIQDIQKKYNDPKRRQEEIMKVYREAGVNPLGCLGPMVLQIPVLFALFYAIRFVLPESPEALERLSGHLYSWSYIQHAIPIEERFPPDRRYGRDQLRPPEGAAGPGSRGADGQGADRT